MQYLHAVSLVVPDYDEAIEFYCGTLGWHLAEDVDQGHKRWVRIEPPHAAQNRSDEACAGSTATSQRASLILARAANPRQEAIIGDQFAGRVGLFLATDDFMRDYNAMRGHGVEFEEEPRHEPYGTVAVWRDPFGNRWDLLQLT